MDLIGHSDTYVKVALRGEANQKQPIAVTSVVSGADPVWREDVALPFEHFDPDARLTFTLWDADTTRSGTQLRTPNWTCSSMRSTRQSCMDCCAD